MIDRRECPRRGENAIQRYSTVVLRLQAVVQSDLLVSGDEAGHLRGCTLSRACRTTQDTRAGMKRVSKPAVVFADGSGQVMDMPGVRAVGRSGRAIGPVDPSDLIPLPPGSNLYLLPGRMAVGFASEGKLEAAGDCCQAVAAFLPPGYVALSLAAFKKERGAPLLPLYCYCAVCWHKGGFHVAAVRVDDDQRHDPAQFDPARVKRAVARCLKSHPGNRLIRHHGEVCAIRYQCPNAMNYFLGRWEAPVAVSGGCNASCIACISEQKSDAINAPQERIGFVPTVKEIVELAVPHLEKAPKAIVSFGQGCEGEPLLRWKLIEEAIREIRRQTSQGTLHINTNGSLPDAVGRLAQAGLDSIRVSLNSARKPLYEAYHRCNGYEFSDVTETMLVAKKAGLWLSLNYLTFPGVTDDEAEYNVLGSLLRHVCPDMIQWRNLNIDPDVYMDVVADAVKGRAKPMGLARLFQRIHREFPSVRHGYFNPEKRISGCRSTGV